MENRITPEPAAAMPSQGGEAGGPSWAGRVGARFRAHWQLKALGTTAFMTLFFLGYLYLLRHPLFPVTVMPTIFLDGLVPFLPGALPVYLSLWIYVSLPPALLGTREELFAFGWQAAGLCLAGLVCFLLWPTAVPTTALDWNGFPGSGILQGVDAAGNACPSLHVATAVFSGVWLHRLLGETRSPRALQLVNFGWCGAIAYSTLAIKQHVALDMLAGTALGLAAAAYSIYAMARLQPAARRAGRSQYSQRSQF
ncbi:MAG TPA: phosphatase PAP2 family protein [Azospira sp.]|nr:phosphatase PAP2 family protein [Azospira sp.]